MKIEDSWAYHISITVVTVALSETNSQFAPENGWLEDNLASFWGLAQPGRC